jgi:hypothetical protein
MQAPLIAADDRLAAGLQPADDEVQLAAAVVEGACIAASSPCSRAIRRVSARHAAEHRQVGAAENASLPERDDGALDLVVGGDAVCEPAESPR